MEREPSEEHLQNELITPEILNGIKDSLDYQKQAWESNPLNGIAVEMSKVAETDRLVELVEMPDGAKLPFVKEQILEELKTKLGLDNPKVKQGAKGEGIIELYRMRKPGEKSEEEEQIAQDPMRRRARYDTSYVEVLRDDRNGKIIDLEIGYPYFRRREHYGL